ncbi:hypothetical protein AVEN_171871-1 [Araneus ventricosus]|uniref:Uncharacterized protein n=1 Tax=Araneus ventricosus TaxID=182803 RepID=A0A4Y2ITV1_ARAVE|nr:hypothetical protein AVEN_171871-1 [Araneus ventricosus]
MEIDLRPMVRQDSHTPARCQGADSLDYPDRWFQSATSKEVLPSKESELGASVCYAEFPQHNKRMVARHTQESICWS